MDPIFEAKLALIEDPVDRLGAKMDEMYRLLMIKLGINSVDLEIVETITEYEVMEEGITTVHEESYQSAVADDEEIEIPIFSGNNLSQWMAQIEMIMKIYEIPDIQWVKFSSIYVDGIAQDWVTVHFEQVCRWSWDEFTSALHLQFGSSQRTQGKIVATSSPSEEIEPKGDTATQKIRDETDTKEITAPHDKTESEDSNGGVVVLEEVCTKMPQLLKYASCGALAVVGVQSYTRELLEEYDETTTESVSLGYLCWLFEWNKWLLSLSVDIQARDRYIQDSLGEVVRSLEGSWANNQVWDIAFYYKTSKHKQEYDAMLRSNVCHVFRSMINDVDSFRAFLLYAKLLDSRKERVSNNFDSHGLDHSNVRLLWESTITSYNTAHSTLFDLQSVFGKLKCLGIQHIRESVCLEYQPKSGVLIFSAAFYVYKVQYVRHAYHSSFIYIYCSSYAQMPSWDPGKCMAEFSREGYGDASFYYCLGVLEWSQPDWLHPHPRYCAYSAVKDNYLSVENIDAAMFCQNILEGSTAGHFSICTVVAYLFHEWNLKQGVIRLSDVLEIRDGVKHNIKAVSNMSLPKVCIFDQCFGVFKGLEIERAINNVSLLDDHLLTATRCLEGVLLHSSGEMNIAQWCSPDQALNSFNWYFFRHYISCSDVGKNTYMVSKQASTLFDSVLLQSVMYTITESDSPSATTVGHLGVSRGEHKYWKEFYGLTTMSYVIWRKLRVMKLGKPSWCFDPGRSDSSVGFALQFWEHSSMWAVYYECTKSK